MNSGPAGASGSPRPFPEPEPVATVASIIDTLCALAELAGVVLAAIARAMAGEGGEPCE